MTMVQLADETIARMKSALDDDLNTAEAQAAMFDMLRKANTALDLAEVRQDDIKPLFGRAREVRRDHSAC